jgi:hypothetical protein
MAETLNLYSLKVQNEVDDHSTTAQTVISQDIKEIYQEIMLEAYQYLVNSTYEDIPCVAGTQNYTPSDFTDVIGVMFLPAGSTNYKKLSGMSFQDYLDNIDNSNGSPSKFVVQGSQIILDRPSDTGTLRVFYLPVVSELAVNSLIPDRFTNVVKLGASYKYFAFDDNPKAVEYKNLYEEAKRNMMYQLSTKQAPTITKLYGV